MAFPSTNECRVLILVSDDEFMSGTSAIAKAAAIDRVYVSQLLGNLEKKGYLDQHREEKKGFIQPSHWALTEMGADMKKFLLDWGVQ